MTWHPSEDDLIDRLQTGADDGALDAHLAACNACRREWDELRATLALAADLDVPEPDSRFEARLWEQIQPALRREPRRWHRRALAPVAAWAAGVALVVYAGDAARQWVASRQQPPAASALTVSATGIRERVLLTALDSHFAETELLLIELLNAPTESHDFAFERTTAQDLVASSRLYRETASETGQMQLAATLEDLEGVLIEVARSEETPDTDAVSLWRDQIESSGLLFKVRAVTQDLRNRQSQLADASKGAL
jgi:hypothetical protein